MFSILEETAIKVKWMFNVIDREKKICQFPTVLRTNFFVLSKYKNIKSLSKKAKNKYVINVNQTRLDPPCTAKSIPHDLLGVNLRCGVIYQQWLPISKQIQIKIDLLFLDDLVKLYDIFQKFIKCFFVHFC